MLKSFFLFAIFYLPICAFAQPNISVNFENASLETAIRQLEAKHSLVFSFTQEVIDNQFITTKFKDKNLEEALLLIFQNTNLQFEIINETFIVLKVTMAPEKLSILCGTIIDNKGAPLAFATIFIPKIGQGINANEEGVFEFKVKKGLEDLVEFSYVGYEKQHLKTTQLKDCPTITLSQPTFSFSEIIVKEYIIEGIEQGADFDHFVLSPDKIDVVPGLTEADVLQMVQLLPGVQSPDESATGLHIRGGTPDQNLILWDGIPVYNSGHLFGMISSFNPYIVDKVKVFRGGFGAEYGGRVAGVIDISSEQQIPEKTKLNMGGSFTHSDVSIVVPIFQKKAGFLVSARQAYTNIFQSPTFKSLSNQVFQRGKIQDEQNSSEENEEDLSLDFTFTDLNAKWWMGLGEKDEISLSYFGIFDKLKYSIASIDGEESEFDKLNLTNHGGGLQWNHQWSADLLTQTRLTYTDFQNTYQNGFTEDGLSTVNLGKNQKNEVQDLTFFLNNQWQLSPNYQVNFGYQFSNFSIFRAFDIEDSEGEENFNNNQLHTFFLTTQSQLKEHFLLKAGIRYNYYTGVKKSYVEPRLSLRYAPHKNWQFKFSAGEYRQFISRILELNDLGFNEELWAMADGTNDSPIVKSQNISAGFLFHQPKFQIEVEGYVKQLSGLSAFSDALTLDISDRQLIEGNGQVKGLDILVKKRWSTYQTWLSYTWSQVNYTIDDLNEGLPFSAPHDRPHALTFMHLLHLKKWQFSIAWKYASGKVYTPANGLLVDEEDYFPAYQADLINGKRLPIYHRLDTSILYQFSANEKDWTGKIGLSFLNLYNRKNSLSRQFVVEYDEETPFLQTLNRGSLRFTPSFMIRASF